MDLRTDDIYRALVKQCQIDIAEADTDAQARLITQFADFVLASAASEGATAIKELLDSREFAPWDEKWVMEELSRATLDAITSWQTVAAVVLERLQRSDETEASRELQSRLAEVSEHQIAAA